MSLLVSTNYAAQNAKSFRVPVYKVAFTGISQQYSTHKIGTCKNYMLLPSGSAADVKPEKGSSSLGSVTFELLDFNNEITAILPSINGVTVTFYQGFDNIAEADFPIFFTGIVTGCISNADMTGYIFTVTDLQTLIDRQVFQVSSSILTGAMSASTVDQWIHYVRVDVVAPPYNVTPGDYSFVSTQNDTDWATSFNATLVPGMTWSYYQASVFINGVTVNLAGAPSFNASSGYVLIDNEIIAYGSVSGSTLPSVTRGALGTVITTHGVGAKVTELLRIGPAHPFDIFLNVLKNTDKTGLSIPLAQINTTAIAAAKAAFYPTATMEFRIIAAVNAKTWLETEIFSVLAAYLILNGGGLVSMKQFGVPVTAVDTLTHDVIRASNTARETETGGRIELNWDGNYTSIYNSVQFLYDYDPTLNTFGSTSPKYSDSASITRYGEYPLVLSSKGFRTDGTLTTTVQAAVGALIWGRYSSGGAPLVRTSVFLSKNLIEPGDIIAVTSDKLPNRSTLKRGVTNALFEVISRTPNWASGTVDLQLLWTSWNL